MTKEVDAGIFIALTIGETQLRTPKLGQDVAGDQLTQCGKWWYERDPVSFQNQEAGIILDRVGCQPRHEL